MEFIPRTLDIGQVCTLQAKTVLHSAPFTHSFTPRVNLHGQFTHLEDSHVDTEMHGFPPDSPVSSKNMLTGGLAEKIHEIMMEWINEYSVDYLKM